jgi:hypothetical protein
MKKLLFLSSVLLVSSLNYSMHLLFGPIFHNQKNDPEGIANLVCSLQKQYNVSDQDTIQLYILASSPQVKKLNEILNDEKKNEKDIKKEEK